MEITRNIELDECETVGELIDILLFVDPELPIKTGLSRSLVLYHKKGKPDKDENPEYIEWIEIEESF